MDADQEAQVYVMCPRCQEISLQGSIEYPLVCCNMPGMTYGTGRCCRCLTSIPVDKENLDFCLICRMSMLDIGQTK